MGVQRGPSARSTSPSYEWRTVGFSYGSLVPSADNAQTTSCRTQRPSRRRNASASRPPSADGVSSLRGLYSGQTTSDYPAG